MSFCIFGYASFKFLFISSMVAYQNHNFGVLGYTFQTISYKSSQKVSTDVISLGITLAMSGDPSVSQNGPEILKALDMWIWWVNEIHGGLKVGGKTALASLKWGDNAGSLEATKNMTEKLLDSEGVDILFGPYGSALTLSAAAVSESKGVVMMASGASTTKIFLETYYLYSTLSPTEAIMAPAVRTLILGGAKTILTIVQKRMTTLTMGASVQKVVNEMMNSTNNKLAYHQLYLSANPALAEVEQVIFQATLLQSSTDLLVGCVYFDSCIMILDAAKKFHFVPGFMLFSLCVDNVNFTQKINLDDIRYILGAVQWSDQLSLKDSMTGWSPAEFSSIFKQRYNALPSYVGASYFAAGLVLTKALESLPALNSADLSIAISRLSLDTFYGPMSFDMNGQSKLDYSYIQYDDQARLKVVFPVESQTGTLIYPIPEDPLPQSVFRKCGLQNGNDSCKCTSKGCPVCTREDYSLDRVTACSVSRNVRFIPAYLNTECQGGFFFPDFISIPCDYIPPKSPVGILVQAFSYVGGILSLVFILWVCKNWRSKAIKASQREFCILIAVGGLGCCLSPLLSLGSRTTAKCIALQWTFHLSFSLMLGCFFVRSFRVWRIFGNKAFSKIKFTVTDTLKVLFCAMGGVAFLLGVEYAVDSPKAEVEYIYLNNVGAVPSARCNTFSHKLFAYLIAFYEVMLLLLACYFSFKNRNVPAIFSETKYVMGCVFEIASIFLIGNFISLQKANDIAWVTVASGISTSLYCISAQCTFFVPKVVALHSLTTTQQDALTTSTQSQVCTHWPAKQQITQIVVKQKQDFNL